MRIVTWNLWGQIGAWPERHSGILDELSDRAPDVLGLQEVWVSDSGSMAHDIARRLGFPTVVLSNPGPAAAGELLNSNAIVSRYPATRTATEDLPGRDQRWVTFAELETPQGPAPFFVTHLSWLPEQGPVRLQQVRALADFIHEHAEIPPTGRAPQAGYPLVLCGDLNAPPHADEIGLITGAASALDPPLALLDAWEMAGHGPGLTWDPRTNPHTVHEPLAPRRIDYVMVARAAPRGLVRSAELVGTAPRHGVHPSDHYGLAVTLAD